MDKIIIFLVVLIKITPTFSQKHLFKIHIAGVNKTNLSNSNFSFNYSNADFEAPFFFDIEKPFYFPSMEYNFIDKSGIVIGLGKGFFGRYFETKTNWNSVIAHDFKINYVFAKIGFNFNTKYFGCDLMVDANYFTNSEIIVYRPLSAGVYMHSRLPDYNFSPEINFSALFYKNFSFEVSNQYFLPKKLKNVNFGSVDKSFHMFQSVLKIRYTIDSSKKRK
jgi:hypothetical protein